MSSILKIFLFLVIFSGKSFSQKWVMPLTNIKGKIIVKVENKKEFIIYKEKDYIVLLSENNKTILNNIDSLLPFDNKRFIASKNKLWGLFDIENKNFIIPPVYEKITPVKGINAFKVKKYGGTAIVNIKNNIILPYTANRLMLSKIKLIELKQGYFAYKWKEKWYFRPEESEFAGYNKPQDIIAFPNGNKLIKYTDSGVWQLFDKNNTLLRKIDYSIKIKKTYNNFCIVKQNKYYGAMDFNCNIIIPIKNNKSCSSINLLIASDKHGKEKFQKVLNQNVFEKKFEAYSYIFEDFYKVKIKGRWVCYDNKNNKIIADSIRSAYTLGDRMLVTKKDSCIFFDKAGNRIKSIYGTYYKKLPFSRVLILRKEKTSLIVDKSGSIIHEFKNAYIGKYNIAFIKILDAKKTYRYLDSNNNEISPSKMKFSAIKTIGNKLLISKDKKYGVIDYKLNEIVPVIYDYIGKTSGHLIILGLNGKKGVIKIRNTNMDKLENN